MEETERLGCLLPKPRGPQGGSRGPWGPAAPFLHLAACLLGGHVLGFAPPYAQCSGPENIDGDDIRNAEVYFENLRSERSRTKDRVVAFEGHLGTSPETCLWFRDQWPS